MARYAEKVSRMSDQQLARQQRWQSDPTVPLAYRYGLFGRKKGILEREIDRRQSAAAQSAMESAASVFDIMDQQAAEIAEMAATPADRQHAQNFAYRAKIARLTGDVKGAQEYLEAASEWITANATQVDNSAAYDLLDQQVEEMRKLAANPEDLATVANFDARAKFARSTGKTDTLEKQLELGAAWMQSQESQRLAREAQLQAERAVANDRSAAGEQLRFTRDMDLSTELRKQVVNPFTQQMQAFNKAEQLLATGDRLGYDFAFTMAIQALDGSVVREGERLAYTGSSGFVAQAVDVFNKWSGNKTPELEAQLRRAIAATHDATVESYQTAVETFRKQTEAYGGDWGRVGSVVPPLDIWGEKAKITEPLRDKDGTGYSPDIIGETYKGNPVNDAALMAGAAATVVADKLPDGVKSALITGGGVAGGLSLAKFPALLKAITSKATLGGAALAAVLQQLGAQSEESANIRKRRAGETPQEYQQRVYDYIASKAPVGSSLTPDQIKVPNE